MAPNSFIILNEGPKIMEEHPNLHTHHFKLYFSIAEETSQPVLFVLCVIFRRRLLNKVCPCPIYRDALERAREQVAACVGAKDAKRNITFTSGGTEVIFTLFACLFYVKKK